MQLKKINTEDKSDFEFVQKTYIESFPPNERRQLLEFQHILEDEKSFTVYVLIDDDKRIGFLTTWALDSFIYAEHFAISPEYRNEGYGKKIMDVFLSKLELPLIIEVELPETKTAERRINFYENLGFKAWNNIAYEQPPYEEKYLPLPMMLMSYGNIDLTTDFDSIKKDIYQNVYKVK